MLYNQRLYISHCQEAREQGVCHTCKADGTAVHP